VGRGYKGKTENGAGHPAWGFIYKQMDPMPDHSRIWSAHPVDADLGRYRSLLRLLAWKLRLDPRLRSRFDHSDVVHETLVRAVAAYGQFNGSSEGELIRWLQAILHNTFREMVRAELAQHCSPDLEASLQAALEASSRRLERILAAEQSSPSERVERREVLVRWAEAVENLPADQRDVVLMRDLHELPVKEIAERLGRTAKAIAGLLLRGRHELRHSFPDYR
jgi:RNA polymerase sigma-70 factor (ECF subfamily)